MRTVVEPPQRTSEAATDCGTDRAAAPSRHGWRQEKLAPQVRRQPDRARRGERHRLGGDSPRADAGGRRLTLDQLISGAWEGLLSAGSAPCPVCGEGRMELHAGTGHCGGCGSRLS